MMPKKSSPAGSGNYVPYSDGSSSSAVQLNIPGTVGVAVPAGVAPVDTKRVRVSVLPQKE